MEEGLGGQTFISVRRRGCGVLGETVNMKKGVRSVSVFSPAKVNLFLAVTGKRLDGFHEVISVVAPLGLGDVVTVVRAERKGSIECLCEDPRVPDGHDNLAAKAAIAWRERTGSEQGLRIVIRKRIPVGGGLGGGSSNAVAVLQGLNLLAKEPLPREVLWEVASSLGSDCPLFLAKGPCVLAGRGEIVKPLSQKAEHRIRGRHLLLFAPPMEMNTGSVYGCMTRKPEWYSDVAKATARLEAWKEGDESVETLIGNDLEKPVFKKWPGFPILLEELRERFGWVCGMSGSGSCCFALLQTREHTEEGKKAILSAWGDECFLEETNLV